MTEAFRAGKTVDRLYLQEGCKDGPLMTILREAQKRNTPVKYVTRQRLDQLGTTTKHQGVVACIAAYEYAEVGDILELARQKGEPPFLFLLDGIEDPHNLPVPSTIRRWPGSPIWCRRWSASGGRDSGLSARTWAADGCMT